jgi:hypothetical protein
MKGRERSCLKQRPFKFPLRYVCLSKFCHYSGLHYAPRDWARFSDFGDSRSAQFTIRAALANASIMEGNLRSIASAGELKCKHQLVLTLLPRWLCAVRTFVHVRSQCVHA